MSTKGLYYYDFVIGDYDMNEQTHRHYEIEGLDEQGIADYESRLMKRNPQIAYCKYIGEGKLKD